MYEKIQIYYREFQTRDKFAVQVFTIVSSNPLFQRKEKLETQECHSSLLNGFTMVVNLEKFNFFEITSLTNFCLTVSFQHVIQKLSKRCVLVTLRNIA